MRLDLIASSCIDQAAADVSFQVVGFSVFKRSTKLEDKKKSGQIWSYNQLQLLRNR